MREALQRLGSFAVVGTVAFIVDISVFNILASGFGVGPIASKVVSVTLATGVSWLGSHYVTFRTFAGRPKHEEALLFGLTNLVGLGIAAACLVVSHYILGLTSSLADNISANVVGVLLGNVFRYLAYRFFVFRPVLPEPARPWVLSPDACRTAPDAHGPGKARPSGISGMGTGRSPS